MPTNKFTKGNVKKTGLMKVKPIKKGHKHSTGSLMDGRAICINCNGLVEKNEVWGNHNGFVLCSEECGDKYVS